MKPLSILFSLCLLAMANLMMAQQKAEAPQFQLGLSGYSYLANQYNRTLEDQLILETPFSSRWGLTAARNLGKHFALGGSFQYRRSKGETVLPMDPRLMIIYVPPAERFQSFIHHVGLVDVFGRWYVQDTDARLRSFVQLGVGAEARFGGKAAFPMSKSETANQSQKLGFAYNGLLFSMGLGLQYRLNPNWGLESALISYWPGGLPDRPFILNQYGLHLGIFRLF